MLRLNKLLILLKINLIYNLFTNSSYSAPSIVSTNLQNFNFLQDTSQSYNNSINDGNIEDNLEFNEEMDRKPIISQKDNTMEIPEFRNDIGYEEEEEEEEEEGDDVRDKGDNVVGNS